MSPGTLRLRVVWTAQRPDLAPDAAVRLAEHALDAAASPGTEFGMQQGRNVVLPGEPRGDGSIVFETSVQPYVDKAGRQRFRGDCVQGPPNEPFLYLSWRAKGEAGWIMRAKVLLTPLTPEVIAALPDETTLQTTVSQMGHRPAGHVQVWTPV